METTLTNDYPQNETFEQFMASLKEIRVLHREIAERNKENAERNKEIIELQKETRKQIEENSRLVGRLSNSFGEMAEHLVAPNIVKKFNALGFKVEKASNNIEIWKSDMSRILTEIDILLENGEVAIVVEVKSKLRENHLEEFKNKMEKIREYADRKQDKRIFLGAIAAAILNDTQKERLLNEGIYVIEQTGDTMKICVPQGFKPREW